MFRSLWDVLPAPVLIGRQYRRPSFTTDEWREKKKILAEKESHLSYHSPLSLEAENIRGTFLKYFWINYVRTNLIGVRATTQIWNSLMSLQFWTEKHDWCSPWCLHVDLFPNNGAHKWLQLDSMELQEGKNLKSLQFDIEVPWACCGTRLGAI